MDAQPSPAAQSEESEKSKERQAPIATDADLRKFALALPGVEEKSHFGTPDFRRNGHIFAQMSETKNEAILKLLPDHQEMLFEASPHAFKPEIWGKIRWARVVLAKIEAQELKALLREAYDRVAPKAKAAKAKTTKLRKR